MGNESTRSQSRGPGDDQEGLVQEEVAAGEERGHVLEL